VIRSLVQPLANGSIDIVGDVHGEISALEDLLANLGYGNSGCHPDGRRLVFVGDLTDRGPDSAAVVDLVKQLVEAECAQCVLGNHDLNILLGHRKHDNHWFFGEDSSLGDSAEITPAVLADDAIRRRVLDFFQTLPLALERDDVRVVHACWDDEMIERSRQSSDTRELYHQYKNQIDEDLLTQPGLDEHDKELQHQIRNPVKVLTSGLEVKTDKPFHASGKWRQLERVHWWPDYRARQYCVFGHFSMSPDVLYTSDQARCVDYGVGKRYAERQAGKANEFSSKLAALRLPERVIMFDEGLSEPID